MGPLHANCEILGKPLSFGTVGGLGPIEDVPMLDRSWARTFIF